MPKRDWRLYFEDIFECINKIGIYTAGMAYNEFVKDDKTIDAVVRNLEVIGEAARQVPDSIKQKYSDIPWKEIIGLRNRVIHEYFGVDFEIVWEIITHDLPKLKEKIGNVLREVKE
jgi:uncharacterized protein with HEPN domain